MIQAPASRGRRPRYTPDVPRPFGFSQEFAIAALFMDAVLEDMSAFHVEKNGIKADAIAARQFHALKQSRKLRLHGVQAMFHQTRDRV